MFKPFRELLSIRRKLQLGILQVLAAQQEAIFFIISFPLQCLDL